MGFPQSKIGNLKSSNHLVRSRQHIWRNCQADLLGGFEIDDKFELFGLLGGYIRRFCIFEDFVLTPASSV